MSNSNITTTPSSMYGAVRLASCVEETTKTDNDSNSKLWSIEPVNRQMNEVQKIKLDAIHDVDLPIGYRFETLDMNDND